MSKSDWGHYWGMLEAERTVLIRVAIFIKMSPDITFKGHQVHIFAVVVFILSEDSSILFFYFQPQAFLH